MGALQEAIETFRSIDESRTAKRAVQAYAQASATFHHDPSADPRQAHRAMNVAGVKAKHYAQQHRIRQHGFETRSGPKPTPAPGHEKTGFAPTIKPGGIYQHQPTVDRQARLRHLLGKAKR